MKTYTGTYICPHCEEQFEWEFVDDGYRRGMGRFQTEVYVPNTNPSITKCKMISTRTGSKALCGYCSHCQMFVELKGIDSIPTELLQ